jgi:hypothetical protein
LRRAKMQLLGQSHERLHQNEIGSEHRYNLPPPRGPTGMASPTAGVDSLRRTAARNPADRPSTPYEKTLMGYWRVSPVRCEMGVLDAASALERQS